MINPFSKFENFGSIMDPSKRKKIAKAIFEQLHVKTGSDYELTNSTTENFAESINKLLQNKTLKELCSKDKGLAEKVTKEVLGFINKAKNEINSTESPFENEKKLLQTLSKTNEKNFEQNWNYISDFLSKNYKKNQIDCNFYYETYKRSFEKKNKKQKQSIRSIHDHLKDKWNKLIEIKQINWELRIIEKWRKKIAENLYKRIEDLKKIQEILDPITNQLGRLFDMSKGNWKKADLDILKKYSDILKQDKTLQQLSEMLGKMQKAEKEIVEELYNNISNKPKWTVEYASKSDLIGIRESDDLSSLLPSETVLLSDNSLQSIFIKKFVEKKLQTFEYQARVLSFEQVNSQDKRQKEKEVTNGPFIICVDTSGSMHGAPEAIAKTLCFAILKIAIRDNRKCFLISFSTDIQTLNLTDLKNSLEKIIEFLLMKFDGGTDASPAMREALTQLQSNEYKKADVLMISDFVMPTFDIKTRELIQLAKEKETKFHSLVIGNSQNQNIIEDFDNNWFYNYENKNSILTLVENLRTL